jgi:O-antigen/teichoic acid export membrane protein
MTSPPLPASPPGIRLVHNAGWNMAGQALPLVAAVAALPFVVRELGPERFGLLGLTWLVLGYFNLFDLGLGRATVKLVAESLGGGEPERAAGIARTSVMAHAVLGVIATVLLYLSVPWLVGSVFDVEPALRAETGQVLRVLAVALPFVLVMNAHRSVLEGLQRFDIVNALKVPFSTALYLAPLAGVLLGWTLVGIVAAMAATRVAAAAAFALAARRFGVALRPAPVFSRRELWTLLAFGGWVGVSNTVVPLLVYLDRLAITAIHSLESLAYYIGAYELASKTLLVPIAVSGAALPIFSGLRAADRDRLTGRSVDASRLVLLLVTPISAGLIVCAGPLLDVYLGPDYAAAGTGAFVLLNIAVFLNALAFVFAALVEGVGRPDVVAKYHVAELPIYLLVLVALTTRFGILGAACAWLLRMSWTVPIFVALAVRVAGLSWREIMRLGLPRDASLAVGVVAAACIFWLTVRPGWAGALAAGAVLAAFFLLCNWYFCFDERERVAVRQLLPAMRRHG